MSFHDKLKVRQGKDINSSDAKHSSRIPLLNNKAIIQSVKMNPQSMAHTEAVVLQRTIGNRAVCQLLREFGMINDNHKPVQRESVHEEEEALQRKQATVIQKEEEKREDEEPVQLKKENNTGLPDNLKAGVEVLSGIDMSDVKVRYNSDKPAQVGALAYTQGTDIHVAPGQEMHLPHEAWHVVQQMQGRVNPTMQLRDVAVNDDVGLEQEADVMGARAIRAIDADLKREAPIENKSMKNIQTVQRKLEWNMGKTQLVKNGRFDFQDDLKQAMTVNHGQHRCHTIGYGLICNGVKDSINACIMAGKDVALGSLDGLIKAVFPNGSGTRFGTPLDLQLIAQKYYNKAQIALNNICSAVSNKSPKVVDYANDLIDALNNSPDNLRPGDGSTNSSIQEALDLIPGNVETLNAGTTVRYGKMGGNSVKLMNSLDVLRPGDATQEQQVETLLTKTFSNSGEIWVFSSGKKLQSSDYVKMKSGTMTQSNPTHLAIRMSTGVYFLFDLN